MYVMYVISIYIYIYIRISTPSLFYSGHLEWVQVMRNAYIYLPPAVNAAFYYIYIYIYMLRILRVGLRVEAHYKVVV